MENLELLKLDKKDIDYLSGWSCTDIDNEQYCFKHSETVFTYKEFIQFDENTGHFNDVPEEMTIEIWNDSDLWNEVTIDFNELSDKEVAEAISTYYSSLEELKNIYGDDWMQIIVECYFEQNYSGY